MNEQKLREDFQKFADSILWSNDDGSEKYIGIGNMADWWIDKIHQALAEERARVVGEIEKRRKEVHHFPDSYSETLKYKEDVGYNQALDDLLSSLSPSSEKAGEINNKE